MTENNILLKMTNEKRRKINDFINNFLGHEPSQQEKKEFTIMQKLTESNIYYKGTFIGMVKYNTFDDEMH